jgi:hypothetical protein
MHAVAKALHPAENRAYRELYAGARQLADHWSTLAERFAGSGAATPLETGAESARGLLAELGPLTAAHGLHGYPAAEGVGLSFARGRVALRDRFLERNQALRLAVLDLQHLTTLLGYLAALAKTRGDEDAAGFCGRWERKLRRVESAARKAAIESGAAPNEAVEPLDASPVGRAAHGVGYAMGTVGEWVDKQVADRRGG